MNILQLQERLKDLPDNALMQEMQMPTGNAPQFLVLSELKRRKRMRDEYKRQEAADMPTVAEEVVTAAGMPQQGIMGAARAMAPNTNVAQNTGMDMAAPVPATRAPQPQMMADGGVVKMQAGGVPEYAQKATFLDTVRKAVGEGTWTRQRSQWVDILGEDAVREAESALMPFGGMGKPSSDSYINPTQQRMERLGIFGNSPGRNIGGEGIASVATSVEKFMPKPSYEKGTGRATMVDGTFVEVMPNGNVFDARTGEMVTGDLAQKAITKLSPDLSSDTTAFTEFQDTPSNYNIEAVTPTQEDLNLRAQETAAADVFPNDVSSFDTDAAYNAAQEQRRADAARMMAINEIPTDKPTFAGDVLPYLGGVTKDLATSSIKALGRPAENDMSNPYVSAIASALEGPTGTEEMAKFLEQENMRTATIGDKAAQLGLTPIERNGEQYFISPAGMVFAQDGETLTPVSGGAAMGVMDVAQAQGKDFSKSPMGSLPLGSYDTDAEGNAIPGTFSPLSIPIGVSEGPAFLKGTLGPESTIGNLLNVQEGVAPTTSVSEEGIRVSPATPDPSLVSDATTIAEQTEETAEEFRAAEEAIAEDAGLPTEEQSTDAEGVVSLIKGLDKQLTSKTSGSFGSTDSRIAKMLADRQKEAESDKWMALAYAGMELMKPTATIGEGLGKAGQAGLGYLTKSKKGLRDFETDMLKLQTQLDMANIRAAGSGRSKMAPASLVTAAASRLRTAKDTLDTATNPVERQNALDEYNAALEEYNNINTFVASQYGYTPSDSTGANRNVPNLSDSAN